MKRFLKVLLTVVLLVMCVSCTGAQSIKETYEENGITITYPASFNEDKLNGTFMPYPAGVDSGMGLGVVDFYYFAMPKAEVKAVLNSDTSNLTEEEIQKFTSSEGILAEVVSIDGDRDGMAFLTMLGLPEESITEVGKASDVTFYAVVFPQMMESVLEGFSEEYREEFKALQASLIEALKSAEYFKPVSAEEALVGNKISFVTTDSEGNSVSSEEIFSRNKVTMINVWATWCPPCVGELAALSQMNERLKEKGAEVVGICDDLGTAYETFKKLCEANNVTYLNLHPFDGMYQVLGLEAFPSSYFVDSEGYLISQPIVGAPADMATYESVIDSYLAGSVVSAESVEYESYVVKVSDEEGKPVAGATVQFCSDTSCVLGTTDESGCASFNAEPGVYTVHLLKVPEGYQNVSEEFTTGVSYGVTEITVRK